MNSAARPAALLIALHAAAFWPVWLWYAARLDDGSDEPWALAALAAAVVVSWPVRGLRLDARGPLLAWAAALTLLYALIAPFAPPLVRAVVAMSALACTWTHVADARAKFPAVLALLVLSVPVIASLQFYAGYPLRILTAAGATGLLDAAGLDVARTGTSMTLDAHTVLVDAPCSGVRMWWTASVLAVVLASFRERVTLRGIALTCALALPVVIAANVMRAALLFVLETRDSQPTALGHSLVGVSAFVLLALLLVASEALQSRRTRRDRAGDPPRLAVRA